MRGPSAAPRRRSPGSAQRDLEQGADRAGMARRVDHAADGFVRLRRVIHTSTPARLPGRRPRRGRVGHAALRPCRGSGCAPPLLAGIALVKLTPGSVPVDGLRNEQIRVAAPIQGMPAARCRAPGVGVRPRQRAGQREAPASCASEAIHHQRRSPTAEGAAIQVPDGSSARSQVWRGSGPAPASSAASWRRVARTPQAQRSRPAWPWRAARTWTGA